MSIILHTLLYRVPHSLCSSRAELLSRANNKALLEIQRVLASDWQQIPLNHISLGHEAARGGAALSCSQLLCVHNSGGRSSMGCSGWSGLMFVRRGVGVNGTNWGSKVGIVVLEAKFRRMLCRYAAAPKESATIKHRVEGGPY